MKPFPKGKDLAPGDMMLATSVGEDHAGAEGQLAGGMRDQFARTATDRGADPACDLIMMAVPKGKGAPFVEGLYESIANDEGGQVIR